MTRPNFPPKLVTTRRVKEGDGTVTEKVRIVDVGTIPEVEEDGRKPEVDNVRPYHAEERR